MASEDLLALLVCPLDQKSSLRREGDSLVCTRCGLRFAIKDGIPNMLIEEAELPPASPRWPTSNALGPEMRSWTSPELSQGSACLHAARSPTVLRDARPAPTAGAVACSTVHCPPPGRCAKIAPQAPQSVRPASRADSALIP